MAVAAATHHSYDRSSAHACTQTGLQYVAPACDVTDTARTPVIECVALALSAPLSPPGSVIELVTPAPAVYLLQ